MERIKIQYKLKILFVKYIKAVEPFFCFISFKKEKLKVLINNHHVINEKFLNEKNIIKFGINNDVILKNIKLKNDRKINLNKDNDLAIIALKDKDNLNEINYLFRIR